MKSKGPQVIKIYYNKNSAIFLTLISLLFILEGFWLIDVSRWPGAFAPITLRVIAAGLIIFFMIPLLVYGKCIFSTLPAILINQHGFSFAAGVVPYQFIHWENVKDFKLYIQQITSFFEFRVNNKYVQVNLNQPQDYIATYPGFQRGLLRFFQLIYHSPVLLTTTAIDIRPSQLNKLLQECLVSFRHQNLQH